MALEFAELLRNFVPLGVAADGTATENALVSDLVAGRKAVLEIKRGAGAASGLVQSGADVLDIGQFERSAASSPDRAVRAPYEAIVLTDVLTYVKNPVRLLRQCGRLLASGGCVVATVPNFGYGGVRLALLSGAYDEFAREYEANPQIRFFTLDRIGTLLNRAGYRLERALRYSVPWEGVLEQPQHEDLDPGVVRQIQRDPDNATLTFVLKLVPIVQTVTPPAEPDERAAALETRLEHVETQLKSSTALNTELREAGRALREQVADLRHKARVAEQLQGALDVALTDLAAAYSTRDDLLMRIHAADTELDRLTAEREALASTLAQTGRRDEILLTRIRAADTALNRLDAERTELTRALAQMRSENGELVARADAAEAAARRLDEERNDLKRQNAELVKRAENAERTALELANELLDAAKTEVQQLSELIDIVQRSRFWRFKRFAGRLGRFFGR